MKKIVLCLAVLLLFSGCAAGNSGGTQAPANMPASFTAPPANLERELVLLTYALPHEKALELVNERLSDAGLPFTLSVQLLSGNSPDALTASYRTLLPEADLACFTIYSLFRNFADEGLLADISEPLLQCPGLAESLPEASWNVVTLDGGVYGYPLSDVTEASLIDTGLLIRGDILEKLNMPEPASPQELFDLCLRARDNGLPYALAYYLWPPYAFHRTYDEWPFWVDENSLVVIYQDGTAQAYAESEIFQKDAALLRMFRDEGLLRPLYSATLQSYADTWDGLAALYPVSYRASTPNAEQLREVQFNPDAGNIHMQPRHKRVIAVSAQGDTLAAVQFLEALYTRPEIYEPLIRGVEGVHWAVGADGRRTYIQDHPISYSLYNRGPLHGDSGRFAAAPADTMLPFHAGEYSYNPDTSLLNGILSSSYYGHSDYGIIAIREGRGTMAQLPSALEQLNKLGLAELVGQYREQYAAYSK